MLKSSDILRAARSILKKEYPQYPVYLEETKEGFKTPAFFMELIQTKSPVSRDRFKVQNTLIISFLLDRGAADSLFQYDVKDKISSRFLYGMDVSDRYLKFDSVESASMGDESDSIEFTIKFEYIDAVDDTTSYDLIMNIETKYKA